MKKDAFYFPHFSNARNDSKLIKVRRVLGVEGYGLYFMLLEVLREQTNFKCHLNSIEDLAFEWHTSKEKLATVINDFDLFTIDSEHFFSCKLIYFLQPYIEKSERARAAALIRWNKVNNDANADANALPAHSTGNASKVKESEVNEIKDKETKQTKFSFRKSFIDLKVEINILDDWLKVRKTKRSTNTETAFKGIMKFILKSGKSPNECIKISAENGWAGFNADWINQQSTKPQTRLQHDSDF